jgi:hypothetical protein
MIRHPLTRRRSCAGDGDPHDAKARCRHPQCERAHGR